jgi:hypothetical protein
MAYVKNVFDKDNITGAFLNSDDTGLTTNVFLNEPRLYGIRATKNWTGGVGWLAQHEAGTPYLFTVEAGGQAQRFDTPGEAVMPYGGAFSAGFDPRAAQDEDLGWTNGTDVRLTYRPRGSSWTLAGGVRYGRTSDQTGRRRQERVTGDAVCMSPTTAYYSPDLPGVDLSFSGKLKCDPDYGPVTVSLFGQSFTFDNKYSPEYLLAPTDRLSYSTDRREEHLIADFEVGKDVGLGALGAGEGAFGVGMRYAEFRSSVSGQMRAVPDMVVPEATWGKYNTTFHQYIGSFDAEREFKGVGPTLSWDASRPILGDDQRGRLNLDWAVTGGVLYGKQKTAIKGMQGSDYFNAVYPFSPHAYVLNGLPSPAETPIGIAPRTHSVLAPLVDLSLGLSFSIPGVKLSTGYRWERYFNVLDAGYAEHESYDRTIDGPYFKVAVGFGG